VGDLKALVTGAPGWLGSRLVHFLVEGMPEVPALAKSPYETIRLLCLTGSDSSEDTKSDRVTAVSGDLTDYDSVKRFVKDSEGAIVFHIAGLIHPTEGVKQLESVNVDGTRNLLRACTETGVKRFVFVSSNSPFGSNPSPSHSFTETSPYNPYMQYGRSKMLAERMVEAANGDKLETVIIRPPWYYGPNQPDRQTLFFQMIKNGRFPMVGNGKNRRSMGYVDNVCQGLLLAASTPGAAGEAYWIADRRAYPMNEIVETVSRVLENDFGYSVAKRQVRLPGFASTVARIIDGSLQKVGLYQQKIHVLSEMNQTIACSIAKAEADLGYDPKVELEEGMRRSIQWVLDRGVKL